MDDMVDRAIQSASAVYYGGEAVPSFNPSFGPDEVAVFMGAELKWNEESRGTNWSVPYVEDWEKSLPIKLIDDHPLWSRMLEFYRKAGEKMAGKMALCPLDLHTNMDILAAIRGPQKLCEDTLDCPELIDRAMADARAIFPKLWDAISEAGKMRENGYSHGIYSMEGAAYLQCDFSCMIGPKCFADGFCRRLRKKRRSSSMSSTIGTDRALWFTQTIYWQARDCIRCLMFRELVMADTAVIWTYSSVSRRAEKLCNSGEA